MVKVGLINNRHPMPVQNFIFEKEIENVFDFESQSGKMIWMSWLILGFENGLVMIKSILI